MRGGLDGRDQDEEERGREEMVEDIGKGRGGEDRTEEERSIV